MVMNFICKAKDYPTILDNLYNEYLDWAHSNNQPSPGFDFWIRNILNINLQTFDDSLRYDGNIYFESEEEYFLFLMKWY